MPRRNDDHDGPDDADHTDGQDRDRDGADADPDADPAYDPETRGVGHPIDPNALMIAAAKASVGAGRLPELLRSADAHLRARRDEYERTYECVDDDERDAVTFLVPEGHWAEIGDDLGVNSREADAIRRAHEQHLLRIGTKRRRRREFESALEVREAVVVGRPSE